MAEEELTHLIDRAARMILSANYVIGIGGAGMSVESGIRPFRGPNGLWTERGEPDMLGYQRFLADPKGWWEARRERLGQPSARDSSREQAQPNSGHYALVELEEMGILKHLITQNVDNLHLAAGNKSVTEIHGNAYKLRCISCHTRFDRDSFEIKESPPRCPHCKGIIKSDGVMFGEPIPPYALQRSQEETMKCDCMLLLGTSGVVYPTAGFPLIAKRRGATIIEVNLYESDLSPICDMSIRGPAGQILPRLIERIKDLRGELGNK